MSFSTETKQELLALPIKMNCCRKNYLFGLLYNSVHRGGISMCASFGMREAAQIAAELLGEAANPVIIEKTRAGRKVYDLEFSSKAFATFDLKIADGEDISSAAKFRCGDCVNSFLRGVIISCATISDPKKGYNLEIILAENNIKRLPSLERLLSECELFPGKTIRGGRPALYFKSNTALTDVLNYAGAMTASFAVANSCIERDIRNNENRATNCVANNISKSVAAVRKQVAAINLLIEKHKLEALPQELRETAILRVENDDLTLSELALLHNPPISKSGLNHRLEKICRAAEELDD